MYKEDCFSNYKYLFIDSMENSFFSDSDLSQMTFSH